MTVFDRNNPALATVEERYPLTGPGSSKCTFHVRLKLHGNAPPFSPGDSIGILPSNNLEQIDHLLDLMGYSGQESIIDPRSEITLSLSKYLVEKANIVRLTPALVRLAGQATLSSQELKEQDPLIFLKSISPKAFPLDRLPSCFSPLLPRFYSIASSPLLHPDAIDLTVAVLTFKVGQETRQGVASHFLCTQAEVGETPIPFYVQPSRHFALPQELHANLIMVGPGTGVAPFRAFLQERMHLKSTGQHWLFFGERHEEHDFFYKDYWHSVVEKERLRLSTAFSRDQRERRYVQHLMEAHGEELFEWLETGGYFYVCGDAKEMARDVSHALHGLVARHGNLSDEGAKAYIKSLKASGRYLTDVY